MSKKLGPTGVTGWLAVDADEIASADTRIARATSNGIM